MIKNRTAGFTTAAFVLTIPIVLLLFLTVADVALLGVEKMRLDDTAFELAREIAIDSSPPEQAAAFARSRLDHWGLGAVDPLVTWRSLATVARPAPRSQQPLLLFELVLIRRRTPHFPSLISLVGNELELRSIAWEPRC